MAYGSYRAGTVSLASGSKVVTGSGTAFVSAKIVPGARLYVAGLDLYEVVASVDSETQLTLVDNASATLAGATYRIDKLYYEESIASSLSALLNTLNAAIDVSSVDRTIRLNGESSGDSWVYFGADGSASGNRFRIGVAASDPTKLIWQRFNGSAWVTVASATTSGTTTGFVAGPTGPAGANGTNGTNGADGATGPAPWGTPSPWVTGTAYTATAPASAVTQGGSCYVCLVSHTSGTFATDLAAGKWRAIALGGGTSVADGSYGDVVVSGGGTVWTVTSGVTDGDKGDIVVSGSGAAWAIDSGVVSNAKLASMANATIKGRVTAGSGAPEDLTAAQARSVLSVREKLAADRTYYVRTDGSDSNTGLSNTSGGAFLTLQKAIDVVSALDISIYNVTINVGAGTYTAGISIGGAWVGTGAVSLIGDTTTPSNVVISTSGVCVNLASGARLSMGGFKLASSGGNAITVARGALAITGKMEYGACASGNHMSVSDYGAITVQADYTISGGAVAHWLANGGAITTTGRTLTLSGTPAFSWGFAVSTRQAQIVCASMTFTGSATGSRYVLDGAALIYTAVPGNTSYLPGNSAGSNSGGTYS